eukprot:4251361-Karenia_brevis.AAC.1
MSILQTSKTDPRNTFNKMESKTTALKSSMDTGRDTLCRKCAKEDSHDFGKLNPKTRAPK